MLGSVTGRMPVLYVGISPNAETTSAEGHGDRRGRAVTVETGGGQAAGSLRPRRKLYFAACAPFILQRQRAPIQLFHLASYLENAGIDMMRPLTIAALALTTTAALAFSALAQTTPAETESPAPQMAAVPAPGAASPAAAPAPTAAGNAENGRLLTYTCQGCHGVDGYKNAYPNYHVPKISGQTAEYLASALLEYQKGARKHPTMQAQAQGFSEQDIADIAAFLSSLK